MELLEHSGKALLSTFGLPTPRGRVVSDPDAAANAATWLKGPAVVKCQILAGKRGHQGGIRFVDRADEAWEAANQLVGSDIAGHNVVEVLVEERLDIVREFYLAILTDQTSKSPLMLFSTDGGMDVEDVHRHSPESLVRKVIDIRDGLSIDAAALVLQSESLDENEISAVAGVVSKLYAAYRQIGAELIEVNPLALTRDGSLWVADCKLTLDASARQRTDPLVMHAISERPPMGTDLELRASEDGFLFMELEGSVGVLANGAGLTMATLDAIEHFGGKAANFLEIGGDSYTKAIPALRLVLSNPRVKSMLINFCGAFARTDVMVEGVVDAIEELNPRVPISITVHGTGEERAAEIVRERLGSHPYELMDDAVEAAVRAAGVAP